MMRCLFCKKDSSATKSIEHIIPESLGNTTFVLPLGYVCDECNNYFARKVEKPFLEQFSMQVLRFHEAIPTKKKKIPSIIGMFNSTPVTVHRNFANGKNIISVALTPDLFDMAKSTRDPLQLILPVPSETNLPEQGIITSRFLAKVALEALAERLKGLDGLDYLVNDQQFDLIRNHARMGTTKDWPCNIRRIYATNAHWQFNNNDTSQLIYECDFLSLNIDEQNLNGQKYIEHELYFIVVLWGIEFAINIGGPGIESYEQWLIEHDYVSPLHFGKNQGIGKLIDNNHLHPAHKLDANALDRGL